jgi:DNA-binding transcriptional LysR family regulator
LLLTPLGQRFYEGCRGLVAQYLELETSIRQSQAEIEARVEVAAIYSVGLGDMGHFVERFTEQYPNTRVHIDYLHPDRVYEKVANGTADFGLVSCPRVSRKWVILPWREERMVLVCSPAHELAGRAKVPPQDLEGIKLVAFDRNLMIRRHVDRYLRDHGVSVLVACEFDSIENIKKAVEVSAGVALLPEPTVHREVESGTLVAVPLGGEGLVRPMAIIRPRHHKLTTSAQRFLDLLRQAEPPARLSGHEAQKQFKKGATDGTRMEHG